MRNNLSTSIPESESVEFVPSVPLGGTRDNSHALCPCVLTENGFMTNEKECRWLMTEEAIESIAMTHVEGIVSYLAD